MSERVIAEKNIDGRSSDRLQHKDRPFRWSEVNPHQGGDSMRSVSMCRCWSVTSTETEWAFNLARRVASWTRLLYLLILDNIASDEVAPDN